MKKFKFMIVALLFVLVCGLTACGPKAVNRDKAFEKVLEFLASEYQISETDVLTYKNVYYAEVTGNGDITKDEMIGDVYFSIRISFAGTSGNQYLYYDAQEDKVFWKSPDADYSSCVDKIKSGELEGVWGELKGAEGEIKKN